jgi:LuxR family maltose regulon positive regulatory protein
MRPTAGLPSIASANAAVRAAPRPRPRMPTKGIVPRPRLVQRLAAAADAPLAVLVAPAGYGKTTLLAQWVDSDARPCAWVTVTPADDATSLLTGIANALAEIEPLPTPLVATLRRGAARATVLLPQLVSALGPRPPFVLVLDDVHHLPAAAASQALAAIAEQLPAGSVLAVGSRSEPPLPLGRARAEGAVVELRAHELAMTDQEAGLLLRASGLELGSTAQAAVVARTEGWPAGLRLAALALTEQAGSDVRPEAFAGDDRLVADYLREELLARLSSEQLTFLTQTAPLDRLSAGVCDAVLGTRGSGRLLHELSRSNVLLLPLDRSEEQFRCHTLLSDMLRAELRRADPERDSEVHRRASAWHERHRDLPGAVDHAVAAGDAGRAGRLLLDVLAADPRRGRDPATGRWLARLGTARIAEHATLALAAAVHFLTSGRRDEAERWADASERALPPDPAADRPRLSAGIALIRAAVARDGMAQMGLQARRAYTLDAGETTSRALSCLLRGAADHATGDRDRARAVLQEGARRSALRAPAVRALCLAQLALLALEQDGGQEANDLSDRARHAIDAGALREDPETALVYAVSAFARSQRGRVDEARTDIGVAHRLLSRLDAVAPWYDAEVRIALAQAELRLGDAAGGRTLLAEASRALRAAPDAVVLQRWLDDAWAHADTCALGAMAGPSSLTTAELRVLRFLPSHLSFREIAARLHVSANTVKTQAHAVYRKLDACSRSQAVARARDVGLVDG